MVVIAFFPIDGFAQQRIADRRFRGLLEGDFAHCIAVAAVPAQVDVRGFFGARHFDLAYGEIGVEITALGETAADEGFALLVFGVFEDIADLRREHVEFFLQITVVIAAAFDRDGRTAHPHRFAGAHGDGHADRRILGQRRTRAAFADGDGGRVIAERLQRLASFVLGHAQQIVQPGIGDALALGVLQRQRSAHVVGHGLVEAVDAHFGDLRRMHRSAERQQHCGDGGAGGVGHPNRITAATGRSVNACGFRAPSALASCRTPCVNPMHQRHASKKGRKRRYGGTGASGCAMRRMPQSRYGRRMSCWVHRAGTHAVVVNRLKLASYTNNRASIGPGYRRQ